MNGDITASPVMSSFVILLISVPQLVGGVQASKNITLEQKLISTLLESYHRKIPPPYNSSEDGKTKVLLGMSLLQIIYVSEKDEELTTTLYMTYSWQDCRLTWDPADYQGIKLIRIPPKHIWTPDIILENSKDGKMREALAVNTLVSSSGTVDWLPPSIYKTSCIMDVALFPFDWQNCSLIFRSSAFDQSKLVFGMKYAGYQIIVDPEAFVPHGEWDLIQKPAYIFNRSRDDQFQKVDFRLIIKRRPQFYVLTMLVPCVMIAILSCFTFYLPLLSGERISLAISLLLGDTIFAYLFVQRMPSTSTSVPLAQAYLLFSIIMLTLCIFGCVLGHNFHYRSSVNYKVPCWLRWVFFDQLAPLLGMKQNSHKWVFTKQSIAKPISVSKRSNSIITRQKMAEKSTQKSQSEILFNQQGVRFGFKSRLANRESSAEQSYSNGIPSLAIKRTSEHFKSAAEASDYIAEHVKLQRKIGMNEDDWAYLTTILDRLLTWMYLFCFFVGSAGFCLRVMTYSYPLSDRFVTYGINGREIMLQD